MKIVIQNRCTLLGDIASDRQQDKKSESAGARRLLVKNNSL
jgi:hypothetical protein